ncbi:MAG TPA: carbon-nitrogen hydrolase family protein [Methylomirabilota bacterium]|nr:carbon-nitrogen hydrolase family protein [Methylomirabilota bacterium]
MKVKLAVVQPRTRLGPEEETNVKEAVRYIEAAARRGAHLVLFPETYPGPWTDRIRYDPLGPLAAQAKASGVWVVAGTSEPVPGSADGYYNVCLLIGSDGDLVGKYRRTSPPGPYIYKGGPFWDFNYTPADDLPVFETPLGTIGILICSEVFVPELSRILALKGAEIILLPTGRVVDFNENWLTLVRARAVENLAFTATGQNLIGNEGMAMVASPERVLAESKEEGILLAELDLGRVRELRRLAPKISGSGQFKTIPGIASFRRPEVFRKNAPE